jgi:hypothetical protein
MSYIPERLKSSRRLQAEIGLAGIALWQLKKELFPKYKGPTEGEDIIPPVSEYVDGSYFYVIPGIFDEDGKPNSVQIGRAKGPDYINVNVSLGESQKPTAEHGSESRREQLLELKKVLRLARKKILSRDSAK